MYARGGLVSYPYYAGDLDEIRISEVIRYSSSFTPPSAPFSTDGDTLALYPLDEGSGQTATDTSGNSADLTLGTSGSGESADPAWMTAAGYAPDLTTGLVAAYGFDEGTGGTTADATANALDGTISGASWTSSGYDGNALTFDGVDDWVTVADAAALDLTDGMTLAAWVYPTTLGDWRTVVFKEDTAGFAYALDADADGASPAGYLTTDVAGFEALDDAPLSANTWTHIAVTYDGANLVLYVNGAVAGVTPASGTIVTTSGALRMGGNSPWGEYFAGRIDSVRIYDRALSPNEVALSQSVAIGDEASVGGGSGGGSPTPSVRSISYSYDGLLRPTEATESPGAVYTYTYDLAGNRTSAWIDSLLVQSASYNDANQVVGWTYDAAGNLLDDGVVSYTYDALNRQVARDSINYFYNGDGVLVALDNGTLTRYVQDLATPLPVILDDGAAQYVYGHERLFGDDGSDRTWYLGDALGSVRMTLDAAGVPLAGLNYDPWGTPQSTTIAPFGFTGEMQQGSSVYLRARWYTPGRGTFVGWRWENSESSITTPYSHHPYAYSLSNPVNWTDPTGKCVPWLDPACTSSQPTPTATPVIRPVPEPVPCGTLGQPPCVTTTPTPQPPARSDNETLLAAGVFLGTKPHPALIAAGACVLVLGYVLSSGVQVQPNIDYVVRPVELVPAPEPIRPTPTSIPVVLPTPGRDRPMMLVQLQEQRGGGSRNTIHHDTIRLFDESGSGVTTAQVIAALNRLRQHSTIPGSNRLQQQADDALRRAIAWVSSRPPGGVSEQNRSWSFYFNPADRNNTPRFDVVNILGTNLRK